MRSVRSRLWAGIALILVGSLAVLIALGPLRFAHRFADRVDVVGTVQDGYDLDAADGTPVDDGTYGIWQVDYSLRGSDHVGFIIGSYRSGEQIDVSVPGDGSVYGPLVRSVSIAGKILSWPLMMVGVPATLVGLALLGLAIRERNRRLRAETRATLLRLGLPPAAVEPPAPPPQSTWQATTAASGPPVESPYAPPVESPYAAPMTPPYAAPPAPPTDAPDQQNPFFKPYDL